MSLRVDTQVDTSSGLMALPKPFAERNKLHSAPDKPRPPITTRSPSKHRSSTPLGKAPTRRPKPNQLIKPTTNVSEEQGHSSPQVR